MRSAVSVPAGGAGGGLVFFVFAWFGFGVDEFWFRVGPVTVFLLLWLFRSGVYRGIIWCVP